jgi:uncharacterized protein YukE
MSENKAKSGTPAPGAGATAQTGDKDPVVDQVQSSNPVAADVLLVADEPAWVQKILDALQGFHESVQVIVGSKDEMLAVINGFQESIQTIAVSKDDITEAVQAVIGTCEGTIKAVKTFDERAKDVVQEIMKEAKGVAANPAAAVETPKVQLNPDAKYVVAKGQSFQDKNDPELVYKAGNDVSGLEPERLENLLSQGIIEEA